VADHFLRYPEDGKAPSSPGCSAPPRSILRFRTTRIPTSRGAPLSDEVSRSAATAQCAISVEGRLGKDYTSDVDHTRACSLVKKNDASHGSASNGTVT
jgi:hypothetical protein